MPKRRPYSSYSSYSSYYGREKQRRLPSPLPYLAVAAIAGAGLAYFHFVAFQSLQGRVLNSYSGAPMPGVVVAVQSGQAAPGATPAGNAGPASLTLTATTGPEGPFSLDKLPPPPPPSVPALPFTPHHAPVAGRPSPGRHQGP